MKYLESSRVSAVIPTYNGLHLMEKNLHAVLTCLRHNDELVIVDDASSDQSIAWLEQQFNTRNWSIRLDGQKFNIKIGKFQVGHKEIRVVIVPNPRNLRFGKSVNRGVMIAKHPLILLLNNDVSPHEDVLDHLQPHFESKKVFAVSPLENEPTKQSQSGKNVLFFKRGRFMHNKASDLASGQTAWVSGGSGLFDRSKWLALDGFDPIFAPAYWEDIDLSFRAQKKGWQVIFESKAIVDHNHESTNNDVFGQQKIEAMSWRNGELFTRKHVNWLQRWKYQLWRPYWRWQEKKMGFGKISL